MNQLPMFKDHIIGRAIAAYIEAKDGTTGIISASSVTKRGRTTTKVQYEDGLIEVKVRRRGP